MTDSEFRADVREAVRRHDPDPSELRALADDLDALADKHEATNETI